MDQPGKGPYVVQCEVLCAPLVKLFPGISPEELQYELLNHGLFNPFEWTDIENQVETMETQHIWKIVEREYQLLKGLWKGPEVPIYIFPLTQMNPGKSKQIPTKNGVAYKVGLIIFLSEGLPVGEIK
ncbi:MAG: hypothetical protein ABS920_01840, partial [Sporosarcina sp.]